MAERGIFVKVMGAFEGASFMTAIEQLRNAASTAGKDVGKSWDSAAAISKRAGDEVIKTEAAVQAATEKRIVVEENLQRAKVKTEEVVRTLSEAELKAEREVELAALNTAKVKAGLHDTRIQQLKEESAAILAAAEKEQDAAKATAALETSYANDAKIAKLKALDEYNVAAAASRAKQAEASAVVSDLPLAGALAAEDNARRNSTKALADQNAAVKANADAMNVAAASQVTSGQKAAAAITALGKGSTIALLAIGGVSAHVASQVEQNMNRLIVMHQEGASSVGKMTQQIYELAGQVPFSVQKLSEGLQLIEQHGYRGQDAMNVLSASAKTAVSTSAQLGDTIGGLTTQLDDMGYQGEKGPALLKDMNTMAGQLVVTMKDLKNLNPGEYFRALHSVEPSASAYMSGMPGNVRSAQISAMMDTLSQTGMTQEQSAPNLARMISVLGAAKSQSPLGLALGQLNIEPENIATQMRTQGPIDVIKTIQDAIGAKTDKQTGMVNMGWQFNNPQLDKLIQDNKSGLSAGGQNFLKNHPEIEKGLGRQNVLKKDLAKSDLSGPESGDLLTLAQWEAMRNQPSSIVKKGGTPELTPGQVYQMLFGTGDVARTGLILGQNPQATKDRANNVLTEGEKPNALQDAFNQAMQTNTNQWKLLGTDVGALAGRIGNDLLPVLKDIVGGFKAMVDFFGDFPRVGHLVIDAMIGLAGAAGFIKIVKGIESLTEAFATLRAWMTAGEIKTGLDKLGTGAATAGATLETSSTTAGTEMKAGATKLSAEEAAAGAKLETAATTAGTELEAGAGKLATSEGAAAGKFSAIGAMGAGSIIAAGLLFGPDIRNQTDKIPGMDFINHLPTPDNLLMDTSAWLQGMQDSPLSKVPGAQTGQMQAAAQAKMDAAVAAARANPPAPGAPGAPLNIPPPGADLGPDVGPTLPDHSAETGTGDVASSGSGGATATGPNVQSQVKFHPIDLNPADMPANKTYDDWISDQKGVQSALNAVDSSGTALAVAQSKMTELTKKGTASQDAWNSASDALAKAQVDNQDAVQNVTIAQQKLAANSKKSGTGSAYDPFGSMSGGFTLPNIAKLLGTFLAEEALGNPYGKLQAAKLGSSAMNPMYTQDINGAINPNALSSSGIVQNPDGSYSTTAGSGTGGFSGATGMPSLSGLNLSSLPDARGAHPQIQVLEALANQFGVKLTAGRDDHKQDGGYHPLGEAGDFGNGDKTPQETNFANFMAQNFAPYIAELIHAGPGTITNIKNGKPTPVIDQPGSIYNTGQAGYHGDHDHIAITDQNAPGFLQAVSQYVTASNAGAAAPGQLTPGSTSTGDVSGSGGGTIFDRLKALIGFGGGGGPGAADMGAPNSPAFKRGGPNDPSSPGGGDPSAPGGAASIFGNIGMPPGTPGSQLPTPGQRPAPSQGGLPGAERARKGKGNDPSATAPWRLTGPSNAPIQQQQFGTGASQQGVTGGGGAGPGGGGSLLGMAESAAALAAGPAAPAAGIAMQEANRLAGYMGQLAGIGAEGLLETFSLSGQNFDPSSTLAGKVITGLAGAKGSGGPNAAGKTAPPLKQDDNKKNQQQQQGDGQNPGVNIGTQNFYGDAQAQAKAATTSISTANMMYGGQRP